MVRNHPVSLHGNCVKDDLNKAEQQWAQRRLFSSPRRRRGRWLWLWLLLVMLLLGFGALLYRITDGITLPPF
jgi:hypothetical protein